MADYKEKEFPKGIFFKEHKQDWINLAVSISREECINWLSKETDDYINIDVKTSKEGKIYGEVNRWKPITDSLPGGSNFQEAIDKQKSGKDTRLSPADAKKIINKSYANNEKDDFDKDDIPF